MDNLRLILLVLGVILIGGMLIYYRVTSDVPMKRPRFLNFFSTLRLPLRKKTPKAADIADGETRAMPREQWDEPSMDDIAELSRLTPAPTEARIDTAGLDPISSTGLEELEAGNAEPFVVVLNIMAKQGQFFRGETLLQQLASQGWRYGLMNIFHFYVENNTDKPLCSLANTVEPGTLEPDNMPGMETPGLSLFMQLPGPMEGRQAFERVVQLARALAEQLGGELCDDSRSVLTMQTIGHIKEQIEAYRFKQKMAAIKNHRH